MIGQVERYEVFLLTSESDDIVLVGQLGRDLVDPILELLLDADLLLLGHDLVTAPGIIAFDRMSRILDLK